MYPDSRMSAAGKWKAVVKEIMRFHKQGRPVLVGTTSVENSEALAERLEVQSEPLLPAVPSSGLTPSQLWWETVGYCVHRNAAACAPGV